MWDSVPMWAKSLMGILLFIGIAVAGIKETSRSGSRKSSHRNSSSSSSSTNEESSS